MTLYARWLLGAAIFLALGAAATAVPDETAVVARLIAADHEAAEGYVSLGDGATVIAKPGSDLHRWLAAHRGRKARLGLSRGENKNRVIARPSA